MSIKSLVSKVATAVTNVATKVKTAVVKEVKTEAYATTGIKIGGYTPPKQTTYSASIAPTAAVVKVATTAGTAAKSAAVAVSKSIGSSVASTVSKHPVSSIAAATFGTGLLIESKEPLKTAAKAPEAIFDAGTAAGKAIDTKSFDPLIEYGQEHPLASGLIAAGTAYAVGKGAAGVILTSKILDTADTQPVGSAIPAQAATAAAILPTKSTGTESQPITPETQIMGKSASTTTKGRVKRRKKPKDAMINIFNNSRISTACRV